MYSCSECGGTKKSRHGVRCRSCSMRGNRRGKRKPTIFPYAPLSPEEKALLQMRIEGKLYKQMAKQLSVGRSVINRRWHNIFVKLGVLDAHQATICYFVMQTCLGET